MVEVDRQLLDWMSDEEYRLRNVLGPVSLVVESNFTADDIRAAQQRYGAVASWMLRRGGRHQDVIRKYPALTLTILVGHAALAYDQGAYWDDFWAALDRLRDPNFENALRRNLVPLLDKFTLARFPHLERQNQYVMILAMHAGIPAHCLGDLLRMIDGHLVQGREASGVALLEWLEEPGKHHRSDALDVPVRNFLRYGGEFAVDILDRIIDVVDSTVVDPGLLGSGLDTTTTGLPMVLLNELVEQLRDNPVGWKGRRATRGSVLRRPTLSYSVDNDQIVVSVPYPRTNAELPWRLSFDGEVREVYAERGWGVVDQDHPPTLVPVAAPVREILLWHTASDASFAVQGVDKADPMLTFTSEGAWIPRRDGLKDAVWVVHPSDSELFDPQSDQVIDMSGDSGSPAGWRGWRSTAVDLTEVEALQLRRGGRPVGMMRTVRKDVVPTFRYVHPVAGCRADDGRPVYSKRPWVMLPPSRSHHTTTWHVRSRRLGENEWLVDDHWDAEDVETAVDPFDDADRGLLGLFEIVVTGPLGADVRGVVFLAEGLVLEFDTDLRVPVAGGGLTPCRAVLGSDTALAVSDEVVEFTPGEAEKTVQLSDGTASAELVIRPPHIEIRTGLAGQPAPWRTTADVCAPAVLAEDRYVAVRVPRGMEVYFEFTNGIGQVVHVEEARRKPGQVFEIPTRRFVDSAKSAGLGRIVARIRNETENIEVAVLAIRPPQLCAGAQMVDGALVFTALIDAPELAVHVWRATAPWLPVRSLPIAGDTVDLPPDLVNSGELRCQVFVDDPWMTIEPPRWPEDSAFRVAQPGWVISNDNALTALSRFLAGEGPAPEMAGAVPEVWPALTFLGLDVDNPHGGRARSSLVKMLGDEPRRAFEALGNSAIPLRDKMDLLIDSELVNRNFAAIITLNELHADPWFGCMVEISDLPTLYRRRGEVKDERAQTLAYLRDKGGELLIEALQTGKASRLYEGCFDQNVFRMDAMPADQVEELLVHLRLVPEALLDVDTRVAGNVEAFRQRVAWMRTAWSEGLSAQTSFALEPIRRTCASAYDVISARNDALQGVSVSSNPWMLMSVQSLILAALARLEGHGRITGQHLNSGMLEGWRQLAELCPRLVATDLLIAEALVVHDAYGDLTGGGDG